MCREADDLNAELTAIDSQSIDEDHLRTVLEAFDPIWDQLFPQERSRILHLLIETVAYDVRAGDVAITFRPNGVRTLTEEVS